MRWRGVGTLEGLLRQAQHTLDILYYEVLDLPLEQLETLKTLRVSRGERACRAGQGRAGVVGVLTVTGWGRARECLPAVLRLHARARSGWRDERVRMWMGMVAGP